MRFFYIILILILFQNCSFDNKSGIWKSDSTISTNKNLFEDFKPLSASNNSFNEIVPIKKNYSFNLTKQINNYNWNDIFYSSGNNLKNFKFSQLNQIIFKSKKLTKYKSNNHILFNKGNVITGDEKGNIITFSISENKIKGKFNFYKKEYKEIKKNLNFIIENDIIYASDNLGFLYALDYQSNKIIWAKNYKIPFRSNIKIIEDKLIASNQNNDLIFFDKNNGEVLKKIPTEENLVKNDFINNIATDQNSLFFLNTYGSLYSFDKSTYNIQWYLNLNQSLDLNPSNLFNGSQIVLEGNKIAVSSNEHLYIIDRISGSIIYKKNFTSTIKPLIIKNYLFILTKNNLIVSLDLNNGNIIYSYNLDQQIADFINLKKKTVYPKSIMMANNKILILLKNSYLLKLNVNGNLEEINKLPLKINSSPIFVDSSMIYLDTRNRLTTIN